MHLMHDMVGVYSIANRDQVYLAMPQPFDSSVIPGYFSSEYYPVSVNGW
jgi:hypothetical protein